MTQLKQWTHRNTACQSWLPEFHVWLNNEKMCRCSKWFDRTETAYDICVWGFFIHSSPIYLNHWATLSSKHFWTKIIWSVIQYFQVSHVLLSHWSVTTANSMKNSTRKKRILVQMKGHSFFPSWNHAFEWPIRSYLIISMNWIEFLQHTNSWPIELRLRIIHVTAYTVEISYKHFISTLIAIMSQFVLN